MGSALSFVLLCFGVVQASVTVYSTGSQAIFSTMTAAAANYTGAAAYNPTVLQAPPVPNPAPQTNFNIQLQPGGMQGLSIPLPGSFFGFSVEFSVANQVRALHVNPCVSNMPILISYSLVGKNRWIFECSTADDYMLTIPSTLIQVPFLNLMGNLAARGGRVNVRVGGNTQETASLVDAIPNGADLQKDYGSSGNPVGRHAKFQLLCSPMHIAM